MSRFFVSRTKKRQGFSFIEVMVTVAVLACGIVLIYKAFFISLDYINHLTYRLHALNLLNSRMTAMNNFFQVNQKIPFDEEDKVQSMKINNKTIDFHFDFELHSVEDLNSIYQLDLAVSWKEGPRDIRLSRSAYIANYKPVN